MRMRTTMTTTPPDAAMPASSWLSLLWLASPALPVGGFSYSEGLEAAVDSGHVHDETSAGNWLWHQLQLTQARSDLAVVAQALPAWRRLDWSRLRALDAWVRQTRESREGLLQTEQMGRSLLEWARSLQRPQDQAPLQAVAEQGLSHPTFPVAQALVLSWHTDPRMPTEQALLSCAFGWAENMVQAAIKSVPLGQSAGQRILARLVAAIPHAVHTALHTPDADRQAFSPMLAILSARHETQYSRLFRS
jgi:urease accessory protein